MKLAGVGFAISLGALLSAQAGTVTFSGRDWSTFETTHRDNSAIPAVYTGEGNTGTIRGVFGRDPSIITPVSLSVGDVVSFDLYCTKDAIDLIGDGNSDWVGDFNAEFVQQSANPADGSYSRLTGRMIWYNNSATLNQNGGDGGSVAASHVDGVHFDWTIDAANHYTVQASTIAGAPLQAFTGSIADLSSIGGFRVGLWDSEQTAMIKNFTIVPEPSSLILLVSGLALAGFLRRR